MRFKVAMLLAVVCLLTISFAPINTHSLSFSMTPPENWHKTSNEEILNNLDKFKLSSEEVSKCISDHKGSVLLVSYSKYKPKEHAGLIPTIQVNLRANPTKNFDEFFQTLSKSAEDMKMYFQDYEFIAKPDTITIDGQKAMYFITKFTMNSKNAEKIQARSRTYAIPNGNSFFQINFTDGADEGCAKLYDDLIKTVKFS